MGLKPFFIFRIEAAPRKPDSQAAGLVTKNIAPSLRQPDSPKQPINRLCHHTREKDHVD